MDFLRWSLRISCIFFVWILFLVFPDVFFVSNGFVMFFQF